VAVRVYWPGLHAADNPFRHPLWIPERIRLIDERQPGFKVHLLARIARASVHRFVPGIARWGDLERAHVQAQIAELKKGGRESDMLKLFETENERLELEIRDLKQRVPRLEGELERSRNEATAWRQSYEDLRKEKADTQPEEAARPIDDAEDAIARIKEEFKDLIEFTGKIDPDPAFDNPDGLYLALRWLATIYRDAKRGVASCPDFDISCREACEFWYRPHQSKVTMGKYEDEYFVQRDGRRVPLHEHIGTGSSKSGRSTMRIAFFFESETEKVVVGFLGQHQSTDAT
jgi:hypothetical protein